MQSTAAAAIVVGLKGQQQLSLKKFLLPNNIRVDDGPTPAADADADPAHTQKKPAI